MELNRLRTVICLGAMLLLMAGVAMAGTTSIKSTPTSPFAAGAAVRYAHEVGAANAVYTLPTQYVVRVMDVIRTEQEDFFIDVSLTDNARFASPLTSAALSYAPIGSPATGAMTFSIFSQTPTLVRFHADVTTRMIEQGAVVISTAGWRILDVSNRIGNGQTIGVKVETLDAKDQIAFDTGSNIATLTTGANYGVVFDHLHATTPTIDVNADRKLFLGGANTTTPQVIIEIGNDTLHRDGNPFSLNAASQIIVAITGDLTGIQSITWQGHSAVKTSANQFTLTVDGSPFDGTNNVLITVNGTTPLDRRTLRVDASVEYVDMPDVADGTRDLGLGSAVLSTWLMNGTVLYTNWTNGNNASLNGRLYVWNPSSVAGAVTAEVFTLPVGFGGSTLVGEMELGVLPASSGINLRVAEDILTPMGITLPYVTNGGNLFIRLTINAAGCTGLSSVFNQNFAYGVNPMVQAGIVE